MMFARRRFLIAIALTGAAAIAADLPLKPDSVRFAVIGDNGTGDKPQFDVAAQMEKFRQTVKFDFVIMLGDNIYGGSSAADMKRKFEEPYKPLLDAGVKFYASLGNHDNPNERFYKGFNMGEKRYYNFRKGNAEFFALDSNYMDPVQMDWLKNALRSSTAAWKICYFHHPLYSDGKFHGPDTDLRTRIEPIFEANGVKVVLSGHEHLYERIKPHNGIYYFVLGNSGELRTHGLKQASEMAKGFDTDRSFMMMEISGDQLFFETISRTGETIDSGEIDR
jgi:3',5'-cyclic AMP phosphodiesterase CpdA